MTMSSGQQGAVTAINQAFTGLELRRAAQPAGIRYASTMRKTTLALRFVGMGWGVAEISRVLDGPKGGTE